MGEHEQHTKQRWRRELRVAIDRIPADAVASLSASICARAAELAAFRVARHVVAYAPIGREVDPTALASAALESDRNVYYPRMVDADIEFVRATPSTLSRGSRGFPEPPPGDLLPADGPEVCFLVPGLGFDAKGNRLGRGAGCYDRALARHPRAVRIGLAYAVQLVPMLPVDDWDIDMHAVVTEAQVHLVHSPVGMPAPKENRP